jgi:hypothetical protein
LTRTRRAREERRTVYSMSATRPEYGGVRADVFEKG